MYAKTSIICDDKIKNWTSYLGLKLYKKNHFIATIYLTQWMKHRSKTGYITVAYVIIYIS